MASGEPYSAETHQISVSVTPVYLSEESKPNQGHFFWAYSVEIINNSDRVVQLQSRYWHITDANGQVQEVKGAGVVGEQPILTPGDEFHYTSGCPLPTSSGFMKGHFIMTDEEGQSFPIDIPAFALDLPDAERTLN